VADVFDALTSRRPYKRALSNDEAFAMLRELAGVKLDPDCVEALAGRREEVEEIQRRFQEDPHG
jgi:HD-GYP domain-containing protein (c-di-GMP phosphodiesterase class II)